MEAAAAEHSASLVAFLVYVSGAVPPYEPLDALQVAVLLAAASGFFAGG